MTEIPEDFWPKFVDKLIQLSEIYNPVSIPRLYPFIVSHLPSDMTERVIARALERGLIEIEIVDFNRGFEVEKQRMIRLGPNH